MTHIIRAPKPRKRGATFADVPMRKGCSSLFAGKNNVAYIRMGRVNAMRCDTGELVEFASDDEPVTLLSVQPIDPEPDPDVCTYGELQAGARFRWLEPNRVSLGLCQLLDDGFADQWGQHWEPPPGHENPDVRRVSVSVVEHDSARTLIAVDGDTVLTIGPVSTVADLPALCSQTASVLAQHDVSPEPTESPLRQAAKKAQAEVDSWPAWKLRSVDRVFPDEPEQPAEDRSKPAPGYTLQRRNRPVNPWVVTSPCGLWMSAWKSEESAVARSWWHYAQQAGGGGE